MMEHTRSVAQFVAHADLQSVPDRARAAARDAILDAVGVALGGSPESAGSIAAALAREEGAKEEAAVFGHGFQTSAMLAAWANGVSAHALDFDSSYVTMGQPMAGLVPTVFALAEPLGASGRDLVDAYLVGYEVTGKLVRSISTRSDGGAWHATATVGSLGCTAAASRLLRLNEDQVRMALGITGSMASGIVANFGTMSKPLHAGLGARNGVMAAKLAQHGFSGNASVLEATNGYFAAFAGGTPETTSYLEELGRVWEIEQGVRYKPYPCGGLCHSAIDAAIALRQEHGLRPDAIDGVKVQVTDHTANRIVFGIPETEVQAKFSMGYVVARALVDGQLAPDTFSDEAIREPAVLELARKVQMEVDPGFATAQRVRSPARVSIRLSDGRTVSREVAAARGGPESPLSADELRAKFRTCATRVLADREVDRAIDLLASLEKLPDVKELAGVLMGAGKG
jgi:2-methylcitrate dehydratase PrpD